MFRSKYPDHWEPDFDGMGQLINEPEAKIPDSTIFLRSSLQGDLVDTDKGAYKQTSIRLPLALYSDIEAIAQSGTLSRNAVIVSLLASGRDNLSNHISTNTINHLNKLAREILRSEKESNEEAE